MMSCSAAPVVAFVVAAATLGAGCSGERDSHTPEAQAPASEDGSATGTGRTFLVDCGSEVTFTVHATPEQVELSTPQSLGGRQLVLRQVPAASGARYEEGGTIFWDHDGSALVEVGGQRFTDCSLSEARAP
jgi:membrane-bound inhibitor of C-type lysozyme